MTSRKERHKQRRQTERLLEEAHEALAAGERALAEKLVARAVDKGSMNPMVWYEAAQVLLALGKRDDAVLALCSALRIAPSLELAAAALAELGLGPAGVGEARAPAPAAPQGEEPVAFGARTARYDWTALEAELAARGYARLEGLLSREECEGLGALAADGEAFLGAGRREGAAGRFTWRYFVTPLPAPLGDVELELFARLAAIADRRQALLGREQRLGASLAAFHEHCAAAGQILPGARRIELGRGGFVAATRDLPGRAAFPLQALVALAPEAGGSRFAIVDDRPGRRDRVWELALAQGDAALSWSHERQVVVGGALGLQPVLWGLSPCDAESAAFVHLPFHLVA